jgi:pantetheine-phosphate adenylyltransferase
MVKNRRKTIGVFGGSFDMFTNGHLDLIKQTVDLFDELHVVLCINRSKPDKRRFDKHKMLDVIKQIIIDNDWQDKVIVTDTEGLFIRYAESVGATHVIKGVRDAGDAPYELSRAAMHARLSPNIKTIFAGVAEPYISSSMIYSLYVTGEDISEYIPYDIKLIEN